MKNLICERCGSNELKECNGYLVCEFCDTKFMLTKEDAFLKQSTISLSDDVDNLLKKLQSDPKNAKRYINLILDIDPDNSEVKRFLRRG